ncbi:MAG: hypothetical protein L0312_05845, partial [Acidobacteria bacterium]|nr:hypothetical protein [Acidobacteriota bacterium]
HHRDVFVVPVGGGEPKLVYAFKGHNQLVEFPAWKPDGRAIVFSLSEKTGDVFVLQTKGPSR